MNDVVKFLTENPVQYLATVGPDGKPRVRPFQFMLERDGRLFFCTNNGKDVYAQIKRHPYVELCTSSPKAAWIRLSGKAVFSKDLDIKRKIIEGSDLVRSIYKTAENPIFEIFYLDEAKAVIADFSGNPPREYSGKTN
jgi:uncharacterized pyridoxamine 5'-phosphate oxidase family protein